MVDRYMFYVNVYATSASIAQQIFLASIFLFTGPQLLQFGGLASENYQVEKSCSLNLQSLRPTQSAPEFQTSIAKKTMGC